MCLKTFFYTKFFGKMVGRDELGNQYYESHHKRWFGKNNRWVIYANNKYIANIDTVWYKWIHYMTDKPPIKIKKNHHWIFEGGVTEYDKINCNKLKMLCNESYSTWNNESIK